MGRVRQEKKREDQKRESFRRDKIQAREKVGKSRNTVFFPSCVAPEGRKVGSLKAAGAEPAGQMRDEKLHAVVARSTCRSQNAQNTNAGPLLEVVTSKKWTFRCRFTWQAQAIVHLVKSEQNVRVLWHFQKRWQACDI